jgi:hypothetical protein
MFVFMKLVYHGVFSRLGKGLSCAMSLERRALTRADDPGVRLALAGENAFLERLRTRRRHGSTPRIRKCRSETLSG